MVSLILALALQAAAPAAPPLAIDETLLEVSAEGTVRAVPDVATFSSGVTSAGNSPEMALAANAGATARLIKAAREADVASADLRSTGLRVGPRYRQDGDGDDTDEVVGYRVTSQLSVRVRTISKASTVLNGLIKAGATELTGPDFSFSDDAPQLRAARLAAVKNAQAEAADYAAALGKRVTRTLRVSERRAIAEAGEDIVVTGNRVRGAPLPLVPIEPGEQEVSVTVWIDYALTQTR